MLFEADFYSENLEIWDNLITQKQELKPQCHFMFAILYLFMLIAVVERRSSSWIPPFIRTSFKEAWAPCKVTGRYQTLFSFEDVCICLRDGIAYHFSIIAAEKHANNSVCVCVCVCVCMCVCVCFEYLPPVGQIILEQDFVVCNVGDTLTPNQAGILVIWYSSLPPSNILFSRSSSCPFFIPLSLPLLTHILGHSVSFFNTFSCTWSSTGRSLLPSQ